MIAFFTIDRWRENEARKDRGRWVRLHSENLLRIHEKVRAALSAVAVETYRLLTPLLDEGDRVPENLLEDDLARVPVPVPGDGVDINAGLLRYLTASFRSATGPLATANVQAVAVAVAGSAWGIGRPAEDRPHWENLAQFRDLAARTEAGLLTSHVQLVSAYASDFGGPLFEILRKWMADHLEDRAAGEEAELRKGRRDFRLQPTAQDEIDKDRNEARRSPQLQLLEASRELAYSAHRLVTEAPWLSLATDDQESEGSHEQVKAPVPDRPNPQDLAALNLVRDVLGGVEKVAKELRRQTIAVLEVAEQGPPDTWSRVLQTVGQQWGQQREDRLDQEWERWQHRSGDPRRYLRSRRPEP